MVDVIQILRSTVPLLRPRDRCPGELYVNTADRIFGYIDTAGNHQDIGPFVFPSIAALATWATATNPRDGILAFAEDSFFLSDDTENDIAGLPGWKRVSTGGEGGTDYEFLLSLISDETLARVAGDSGLAGDIVTVQDSVSSLSSDIGNVNARVTIEVAALSDVDEALASRSTNIEASIVRSTGNSGNLIDNPFVSMDSVGWVLNGWTRQTFGSAPSPVGFEIVTGVGLLTANGGNYRPLPLGNLLLRASAFRSAFGGGLLVRVLFATATGTPLPTVEKSLVAAALNVWETFTHEIEVPVNAATFLVQFVPNGQDIIRLVAPFLGLIGQTAAGNLEALSARIDTEEAARIAGDTAQASRSTTIEATALRQSVRRPDGLVDYFEGYLTSNELRTTVGFDAGEPSYISLVLATDGGGKALQASPQSLPSGFRSVATIPVVANRVYKVSFDVEAVGGAISDVSLGCAVFDATGSRRYATSGGRDHLAAAFDVDIPANTRVRLTGYISGSAAVDSAGMGVAAPNRENPHPLVAGAANMGWLVYLRPSVGALHIHSVEIADVSEASQINSELVARIISEETARVTTDTAIASRTLLLEASARNTEFIEPFNYISAIDAEDRLELPAGMTWEFIDDPTSSGGRALQLTLPSTTTAGVLRSLPDADVIYDPSNLYEVRGRLRAPATNVGNVRVLFGPSARNQTADEINTTDFGTYHYQGGDAYIAPDVSREFVGYIRGIANTEEGAKVGLPSPDSTNPAPMKTATAFIAPQFTFLENATAGNVLIFEHMQLVRVGSFHNSLSARINTEETARADADTALGVLISQIIAQGSQGVQTFRQATAPPNPEIGWIWFKSDEDNTPYRYSGTVWELVASDSLAAEVVRLDARVDSEQTARVSADVALASDISVLEANYLNLDGRTSNNEAGLTTVNARVTTESNARADADAGLAGNINTLSTSFTLSTGALTTRIDNEETARAGADFVLSNQISSLSGSVNLADTQLQSNINTEATVRADADSVLATRATNLEATVNTGRLEANTLSARFSSAESAYVGPLHNTNTNLNLLFGVVQNPTTGLGAVSSTVSTHTTQIGGLTTTVSQQTTSINGVLGKWGVTVDVNGNVAGIQLLNGTGGSSFRVLANVFSVVDPADPENPDPVFEVSSGITRIRNAVIGTANVGTVNIQLGATSGISSAQTVVPTGVIVPSNTGYNGLELTLPSPTGGPVRIDYAADILQYPAGAEGDFAIVGISLVRIQSGNVTVIRGNALSFGGILAWVDVPAAAASATYRLRYDTGIASANAADIVSQLIILTEFKR